MASFPKSLVQDAFDELYKSSPLPKNVIDQRQEAKGVVHNKQFVSRVPLSMTGKSCITNLIGKSNVLQGMKQRANIYAWETDILDSSISNIAKNSLSLVEFGTGNSTLNLTNDIMSVSLPERNPIYEDSRKTVSNIQYQPLTPEKTNAASDEMATPWIKSRIDEIVSSLDCDTDQNSDTSDDPLHFKLPQGKFPKPNNPRRKKKSHNQNLKTVREFGKGKKHPDPHDYPSPDSTNYSKIREKQESNNKTKSSSYNRDVEDGISDTDYSKSSTDGHQHTIDDDKSKEKENPVELKKIGTPPDNNDPPKYKQTNSSTVTSTVKDVHVDSTTSALSDAPICGRSSGRLQAHTKKPQTLENWIIIPLYQCKAVCVEGLRSEDSVKDFWKSSAIVDRIDSKTVMTASGTVYKLVGNIEKLDALAEDLPLSLVKKFRDGFPLNWKELIQNFFKQVEKTCKKKSPVFNKTFAGETDKTKPKSQKTHKSEQIRRNLDVTVSAVPCPALEELPRTRSGRAIKPQLAYWLGQRVLVHNRTGLVEIADFQSPLLGMSMCDVKNSKEAVQACNGKGKVVMEDLNLNQSKRPNRKNKSTKASSKVDKCETEQHLITKYSCQQPTVVLKNITKENSVALQTRSQNNGNAPPLKNLRLEVDVIKILADHKRQRLSKRTSMNKETCYRNSAGNTEEPMSSDSEIDDYTSQYKEDAAGTGVRNKTLKPPGYVSATNQKSMCLSKNSKSKEIVKNYQTRLRTKTVNQRQSNMAEESDSDISMQSNATSESNQSCKSNTMSKSKVSRKTTGSQNVDNKANEKGSGKIRSANRKPQLSLFPDSSADKDWTPNTRQRSMTRSRRKTAPEQPENCQIKEHTGKRNKQSAPECDTWSKEESDALHSAVKQFVGDPQFWQKVAAALPSGSRTVQECQDFYYRSANQGKNNKSKSKGKVKTKASQPVKLTGRIGTLKRKRELRDMMEQFNEEHEDDYFDSTPMRKLTSKAQVCDDSSGDDDVFGDKLPFDTPAASRTPSVWIATPVSTLKTPHFSESSPLKSFNSNEDDRYINRLKKRRITTKSHGPKNKKKSDVKPRVQYTDDLFTTEPQSDKDSEMDSDYYWSDEFAE